MKDKRDDTIGVNKHDRNSGGDGMEGKWYQSKLVSKRIGTCEPSGNKRLKEDNDMSKKIKEQIWVGAIVAFMSAILLFGVVRAQASTASVDWDKGVISAMAMTDPLAQRGTTMGQRIVLARTAALGMAESYLLGAIEGIEIDRSTTIKEAIVDGDLIEKRIQGNIRKAMVVEEGINELDLYEVRVAVRLVDVAKAVSDEAGSETGSAFGLLDKARETPAFRRSHALNREYLGVEKEETTASTSGESASLRDLVSEKLARAGRDEDVRPDFGPSAGIVPPAVVDSVDDRGSFFTAEPARPVASGNGYTSLVIDGRKVEGLVRDRAPIIYSDDGQTIFKGWEIPYYADLDKAVGAGGKSLVIEPVGVKGENGMSPHVVVTAKDAGRVMSANKNQHFLEDGRVMIVIEDK